MNITIDSSALRLACSNAARTIPGKPVIQLTSCFLFETTNDSLCVITTDGDNRSQYHVPANVSIMDGDRQSFCLEGTRFLDMLRELPAQPIGIDVKDNTAIIRYHNGVASIPVLDATEFPRPIAYDAKDIRLPISLLRDIIACNTFAVADDILRPVMNGICFDFKDNELITVSTDGHRLCRYAHPGIEWESGSYILSKRCIGLLSVLLDHHAKRLPKGEDRDVLLSFSEKTVRIRADKDYIECRLIDGRYPKYDNVIPHSSPYHMEANRQVLLASIRRVMAMGSDDSLLIEMSVSCGRLVLRAKNVDFSTSSEEKIPCRWTGGEDFRIGFRATFLRDILSYLATDEVTIELTNQSFASVTRGVGDKEDVLMLLMPMVLDGKK